MNKRVACFSEEHLAKLAAEPNTMVMQPTYDTQFEPWPAQRVNETMDVIVMLTNRNKNLKTDEIRDVCKRQPTLLEFSEKYKLIFQKLTDPAFVEDVENLSVLKKMVLLKASVDNKIVTAESAQSQVSDLALKSLASRVSSQSSSSNTFGS